MIIADCPPTGMFAERVDVLVLGSVAKETNPLALPEPPPVMRSHAAVLAAVQAQPAVVPTDTEPDPPPAGEDWLDGDRVKPHVAAAACAIVMVWPATVKVPVRGEVELFAATV